MRLNVTMSPTEIILPGLFKLLMIFRAVSTPSPEKSSPYDFLSSSLNSFGRQYFFKLSHLQCILSRQFYPKLFCNLRFFRVDYYNITAPVSGEGCSIACLTDLSAHYSITFLA